MLRSKTAASSCLPMPDTCNNSIDCVLCSVQHTKSRRNGCGNRFGASAARQVVAPNFQQSP
jgi:hypothetical protein